MNARRIFVAVFVLLAVATGVFLVHARHARVRQTRDAYLASIRTQENASIVAATTTRASLPTPVTIANDAKRSAQAWLRRARQVASRKRQRLFGKEIAAALDKLPAQAWSDLKSRGEDGDTQSVVASAYLDLECKALVERPPRSRAAHSPYAEALGASTLPAQWIAFLREVDAEQQIALNARIDSCADVGGVTDLLLTTIEQWLDAGMDVQTPLDDAMAQPDNATAIAALRELAALADGERARHELGERLMRSRDPAWQAEGLALLEPLAADDADLAAFIANCLQTFGGVPTCRWIHPDATVARAWLEHAAGLGSEAALEALIADLRGDAKPVDAWAWSLYRLDLALAGCFVLGQPGVYVLGQAVEAAFRVEQLLDGGQREQGRLAAAALANTWQARALADAACGG